MKIGAIQTRLLEQRNETFREYLQSGVEVRFFDGTVQAVHCLGGATWLAARVFARFCRACSDGV